MGPTEANMEDNRMEKKENWQRVFNEKTDACSSDAVMKSLGGGHGQ